MIITIRGRQGTGKTAVAEALRDYFSYRGVACIIYDYLQPIREMCEAVKIAASNWGIEVDENDALLLGILYERLIVACHHASVRRLAELTSRWDELKLHYFAIIDNVPTNPITHDKGRFGAFNVLVTRKDLGNRPLSVALKGESHPLEVGLNDCAVSNIFDLVVDTSETTPKEVANLIGDKIHDKMKTLFARD